MTHHSRRRYPALRVLAVTGLLAAGCGGGDAGGTAERSPAAAPTGPAPAAPGASGARAPRPMSPQEQAIFRSAVEAGVAALNAGRFEEASAQLSIAAGVQPENAHVLRLLGNAHARNNDLDRAKRVLEASIRFDPTVAGTHYELAQVAMARGELDLALTEAERTASLDPRNPKAKELHGMVLYRLGRVAEAMALLEPVVSLETSRPDALLTLGLAYQAAERFEKARDAFQAVVRRAPDNAEAWFNLGKVLAILGDEAGAEEANAAFLRLSGGVEGANAPPGVTP